MSAALSADGGREAIQADGAVNRRFKITGHAAEGFHIRFISHRTPQAFTITPQPPADPETIAAARRVGANLYKLRKETALSTDRLLEETK